MAVEQYNNFVETTLNDAGGISDSDNSFTVTDGSGFPDANFRILMEDEIMLVGSRTGNTFSSVTRGAESSTNVAHADGLAIYHVATAGMLDQIRADSQPSAAISSKPTSNLKEGIIFRSTDGILTQRYTGAAWEFYWGGKKVTPPASADFSTWVNQGSATATWDEEGLFLSTPGAAGANQRGVFGTIPSAPYTITFGIIPIFINTPLTVTAVCGPALRESSSGKLIVFHTGISNNVPYSALIQKHTNPTTFSANYTVFRGVEIAMGSPVWIKLNDNSTNRIWSLSMDGKNFIQVHSVGRTDFMTPDQYGFAIANQDAAALTYGVSVIHALEE
jgi:hypothetical protein